MNEIKLKKELIEHFQKYYSLDKAKISKYIDEFGIKTIINNPELLGINEEQAKKFKSALKISILYSEIMGQGDK